MDSTFTIEVCGMTDDIVTRLRDCAWVRPDSKWATESDKTIAEAADEIEQLRRWKELAYDMRNSRWWALRRKHLARFDELHRADWEKLRRD